MKKMKRQVRDSEKIPENHMSHRGLVPRIYKERSNSTVKNTTIQIENG